MTKKISGNSTRKAFNRFYKRTPVLGTSYIIGKCYKQKLEA
jgi:hypothetical protein